MMYHGSEWYVMRDRRIAEVRAYYHYDESKDCELNGFPYNERPYLEKYRTPSGAVSGSEVPPTAGSAAVVMRSTRTRAR